MLFHPKRETTGDTARALDPTHVATTQIQDAANVRKARQQLGTVQRDFHVSHE